MFGNQTHLDRKEARLVYLGLTAACLGSFIATDACLLCEVSPSFFWVEALALLLGAALCWSIMATPAECIARRDRFRSKDRRTDIRRYLLYATLLLLSNCADFCFRVSDVFASLEGAHALKAGAFLAAKAAIVGLAIEVTSWAKAAERGL